MMTELKFSNENLLKTMLSVAQDGRILSKEEMRYYNKLKEPSATLKREIITYLANDGCLKLTSFFPKLNDPHAIVFPYSVYDNQGLNSKGEDRLYDLLLNFDNEKKIRNKEFVAKILKWIFGIVATVIAAVLLFYMGFNK